MLRLLVGCLLSVAAWGQTAQPAPSFEVADLKLNTSDQGQPSADLSNGRLMVRNIGLRFLIAEAWTMTPDDIFGPSWLDDVHVDVVAKAASPNTPDADLRLMVQTLLRDRMKMVAHIEERSRPVLVLSVWKGQPKLTQSENAVRPEDADCSEQRIAAEVRMVCKHMTMAGLVHELPQVGDRYVDKRVVDQTGLQGAWDFTVQWTPLTELENNGGRTLLAALQDQLGLHIENKKTEVPVVVIDSIERKPTDN